MPLKLPRLYPITDTHTSGLSHCEQVERLAAGGASLIQLREKRADARRFYDAALEVMTVASALNVRIVINDRVDIAIAVGSDGVHLGQEDLDPCAARKLLGEERIIGYSTHSLEQALEAASKPVDYIAIGPVFPTTSEENPDACVGLGLVSELRRRISLPLVAIGGINLENISSVLDAGADCAAVISDLLSTADITERTRTLLKRATR